MKNLIHSRLLNAYAAGLLVACGGAYSAFAQQPAPTQKYALLVGVTQYPNLEKRWWLDGPANDVATMAELLEGQPFSIPASRITRLSGWPRAASERPTRANIATQFQRLAEVAQRGDQVVILMAGHGSQQPATDDPANDEPDGLDEIFLPADAGKWDGNAGTVANAIVDDDIRVWVTAIRNKGAFVWLIFDSCHSGTMVRGTSAEHERQIPMTELVPESVLRSQSIRSRGTQAETQLLGLAPGAADIIALYASQSTETTPEKKLPNPDSAYHGLFTYTIAKVLKESRSPLTYRDVAERVIEQYRSEGRFGPTPMFEGGGVDREVLGERTWPERAEMLLGPKNVDKPGWALRAGSIHGLTPGTILELFPPAGDSKADTPIGHVTVRSVEATTAVVEPTAFGKMPAPAAGALVPGSRARVASYVVEAEPLRVALQVHKPDVAASSSEPAYRTVAAGSGPPALEKALANLPERTMQLARRTDNDADADWVMRSIDGRVVLLPGSGWYAGSAGGDPGGAAAATFALGVEADPQLPDVVQSAVRRIARARSLLKIAGSPASGGQAIAFAVELVRYENSTPVPVPLQAGGRTLRAGDIVAFRIVNEGTATIDATLLLVDSGYGIEPIFPSSESVTRGRLDPGQTRMTDKFNVTAARVELEQVVAIAVKASNPPVDFSMLAQEALPRSTREGPRSVGPGNALKDLLQTAMFGGNTATTRSSFSRSEVTEHAMHLVAWRVEPKTQ